MPEDMQNPSAAFRAIASKRHAEIVASGVVGPHYKKTYEELETTDPKGFEEFNAYVVHEAETLLESRIPQPSVNLPGYILTVSRDGRSAVIKLDEDFSGMSMAVVSPDTRGRIPLMNKTRDGKLAKNIRVRVLAVEVSSEALRAVEICAE